MIFRPLSVPAAAAAAAAEQYPSLRHHVRSLSLTRRFPSTGPNGPQTNNNINNSKTAGGDEMMMMMMMIQQSPTNVQRILRDFFAEATAVESNPHRTHRHNIEGTEGA